MNTAEEARDLVERTLNVELTECESEWRELGNVERLLIDTGSEANKEQLMNIVAKKGFNYMKTMGITVQPYLSTYEIKQRQFLYDSVEGMDKELMWI